MGKKDKGVISPKKCIKGLELQLGLCQHHLVNEKLAVRFYKDVIIGLLKSSNLLRADTYVCFEKGILFFEDKLNGLYVGAFITELSKGMERLPMHIFGIITPGNYHEQLKTAESTVVIEVPQLHLSGHSMPYIHRETLNVDSTLDEVYGYALGKEDVKD